MSSTPIATTAPGSNIDLSAVSGDVKVTSSGIQIIYNKAAVVPSYTIVDHGYPYVRDPETGAATDRFPDAAPGTRYVDLDATNGATEWVRTPSVAYTAGWVVTRGDTNWRDISFLVNPETFIGNVYVRRVNELVYWRLDSIQQLGTSSGMVFVPFGSTPEIPWDYLEGYGIKNQMRVPGVPVDQGYLELNGSYVNGASEIIPGTDYHYTIGGEIFTFTRDTNDWVRHLAGQEVRTRQ